MRTTYTLDCYISGFRRYAHVAMEITTAAGSETTIVLLNPRRGQFVGRDSMWECAPAAIDGIRRTLALLNAADKPESALYIEVLDVSGTIVDTRDDAVAVAAGRAIFSAMRPGEKEPDVEVCADGTLRLAGWSDSGH